METMNLETKICVIGLGYVGLPLARLFSTKYKTVGFDMNQARVDALMEGHDATLEVSDELLQSAIKNGFTCTTDIEKIRDCNFYVVAVPTPVDENNNPDLTPLYGASTTVGKVISKGDIVVYESTVYPVHSCSRESFGVENECRFLCRLQSRTYQPGRQTAYRRKDKESDFRLNPRNRQESKRGVFFRDCGRNTPRTEH